MLPMANSGIYVRMTKISEICGGKIDFQLRVRVINLWTIPDRANSAEEGSIHMIFLDGDLQRIHATVRKDLIPQFKEQIEEGSAYVFERFMVAKNDTTFRTTTHKHKLNFMRGTKVFKVTANEIPKNHFDFMAFEDIPTAREDDKMIDVIGHVVEKNIIKETEKNGRKNRVIDSTLEDLEGNRLHCTLWGDYAVQMQHFFESHDSSLPVVMVIQLGKLKKFLGTMGISNSFYGTKLMLNAQIPEVTDYVDRMNNANVALTQVVSQMTGPTVLSLADDLLQTPRMTIEDLIESSKKCYGSVLVWACEFDMEAGWFYHACTKCAARITFNRGNIFCENCKLPRTAIPRFKVHLQVIDNTGSITFVLFDRVVAQILGRTAQDLLDAMNNGGSSNYPSELDVFVDKRTLFKVEVNDANLYRNWRGYTVKKLTYDEDIINRFTTLHGINEVDDGGNGGDNHFGCGLADNTEPLEGGDSSNNDEIIVYDVNRTPTSKAPAKTFIDISEVSASTTKGPSTSAEANVVAPVIEKSATKHAAKRSANVDGGELSVAREIKFPCVEDPSKN